DTPTVLLTAETLRKLESLRIENKAEYIKEKTLFDGLTNLPRERLEEVLPTATSDTRLKSLLEQRSDAEQKLVELKRSYGPADPKLKKANEQLADLNGKISDRVHGIMLGLNARVQSAKEGLDQI